MFSVCIDFASASSAENGLVGSTDHTFTCPSILFSTNTIRYREAWLLILLSCAHSGDRFRWLEYFVEI